MSKEVQIIFTGLAKAGKTTLLCEVARHLGTLGFAFKSHEGEPFGEAEDQAYRLHRLFQAPPTIVLVERILYQSVDNKRVIFDAKNDVDRASFITKVRMGTK
jgi:hypothetical protein